MLLAVNAVICSSYYCWLYLHRETAKVWQTSVSSVKRVAPVSRTMINDQRLSLVKIFKALNVRAVLSLIEDTWGYNFCVGCKLIPLQEKLFKF